MLKLKFMLSNWYETKIERRETAENGKEDYIVYVCAFAMLLAAMFCLFSYAILFLLKLKVQQS